jgi:hypothetical protein
MSDLGATILNEDPAVFRRALLVELNLYPILILEGVMRWSYESGEIRKNITVADKCSIPVRSRPGPMAAILLASIVR